MNPLTRTSKARATPHRPDCPCRPCSGRRRRAGLPEPAPRQGDDLLARRALTLERKVYAAQRAVDRAPPRLLAQLRPAQRQPGAPGDPMGQIRAWNAAGQPEHWPGLDDD